MRAHLQSLFEDERYEGPEHIANVSSARRHQSERAFANGVQINENLGVYHGNSIPMRSVPSYDQPPPDEKRAESISPPNYASPPEAVSPASVNSDQKEEHSLPSPADDDAAIAQEHFAVHVERPNAMEYLDMLVRYRDVRKTWKWFERFILRNEGVERLSDVTRPNLVMSMMNGTATDNVKQQIRSRMNFSEPDH